jgi:type II secretion system protein N
MRTALKGLLAVTVLFTVVLGLTFPTDDLVRWVLSRAPVPEGYSVTFRQAHLRPWGLVLDDAAYRHIDGRPVIELESLRFRPSWTSFWSDRLGRPWHVSATVFGGTIEGRIATDGTAQLLDAAWSDIDVGDLLTVLQRERLVTGRSTGRATLRLPASDPASGEGDLTLRSAAWQPPLEALEDLPIHADQATLRWTLADRRVQLSNVDMRGEEVDVTAQGTLGLERAIGASPIDVRMTIAPLPGIPLELRRLLDGLPRRPDGVHDFRVTGTIDAPHVSAP